MSHIRNASKPTTRTLVRWVVASYNKRSKKWECELRNRRKSARLEARNRRNAYLANEYYTNVQLIRTTIEVKERK
jgi:hypothetical protein